MYAVWFSFVNLPLFEANLGWRRGCSKTRGAILDPNKQKRVRWKRLGAILPARCWSFPATRPRQFLFLSSVSFLIFSQILVLSWQLLHLGWRWCKLLEGTNENLLWHTSCPKFTCPSLIQGDIVLFKTLVLWYQSYSWCLDTDSTP